MAVVVAAEVAAVDVACWAVETAADAEEMNQVCRVGLVLWAG